MWENVIGLFDFYIAYSEILFTACADYLFNNSSLIKLCLSFAKQNAAVETASDDCSLFAKSRLLVLFA